MATRVTFDTTRAEQAFARLGDQAFVAASRALNRSAGSVRTIMGREIARNLSLKVGTVNERIHIRESTPQKLVARITANPKRIPLEEFSASGSMPSRGRGQGVSVRIGGVRKRYRSLFRARMASGHVGVFGRGPKSRSRAGQPRSSPALAIHERFGPSIAYVFGRLKAVGIARGVEQLRKNLVSELKFALRRRSTS